MSGWTQIKFEFKKTISWHFLVSVGWKLLPLSEAATKQKKKKRKRDVIFSSMELERGYFVRPDKNSSSIK